MNMGRAVCFVLVAEMVAGVASAQKLSPNREQEIPSARELRRPALPLPDRVSVERFVAEPWPLAPTERLVTLRVTVRNMTPQSGGAGETLPAFKLRIVRTSPAAPETPFEVTVANLAPGQTRTISHALSLEPAVAGTTARTQGTRTVEFTARADPDNTLGEGRPDRVNNDKPLKLSFTLPRDVAAAPVPKLRETQMLNYEKAKLAGAQFYHNVQGLSTCQFIGQGSPPDWGTPREAAVFFRSGCDLGGTAHATPEAYKAFRLKNGWKIKSVEVKEGERGDARGLNPGEWQWLVKPSVNSDDPYMKMDLVGHPLAAKTVSVFVQIEGPAGVNPYQ